MPSLITASTLASLLREPNPPLIFDASWHMPSDRNALDEFHQKHIKGAHFFNLDAFCDPKNPLPNMLSTEAHLFAQILEQLGVTPHHKIVFYDNSIFHTACRAYWILLMAGHAPNQLFILNGGMHAWAKFNGQFASGKTSPLLKTSYPIYFQPQLICDLKKIKQIVKDNTAQLIDLRHPVRFVGGPEPRLGVRFGHIPKSFSFPYLSFTDKYGYFYPLDRIRKNLFNIGVNFNEPIISLCGSGMSAPMLNFFLSLIKHPQHQLYDGSWSEWGAIDCYPDERDLTERPIETCL